MTRPTPSHFALQRLALAGLLCCLSGLLALAMPSPALAACAGNTNVETETALNDAIAAFNSGGAGCEFTITFMNDISLSGSTTPISNSGAGSKLLIEGNGNVLNGQGTSGVRPFQVVANTVVAMNHITITGGMVSSSGGGILNGGFLTIQDSTISSNEVNGNAVGGGISNSGTLIVTRSTIAGNRIRTGNSGGGHLQQWYGNRHQ
jgi:hypothetical protein